MVDGSAPVSTPGEWWKVQIKYRHTRTCTLTHLVSELEINVLYTPFKCIAVHCCLVVLSVENQYHSDFVHLRNMLVRTHMQDLKDMTHDTHYESYRAQWLCKSQRTDVVGRHAEEIYPCAYDFGLFFC